MFLKNENLLLANNYFNKYSLRSEKKVRIMMIPKFYELIKLHAHKANKNTVLGKAWNNFINKWEKVIVKK